MSKEKNIHFTLLNSRPSKAEALLKTVAAPVYSAIDFVEKAKIFRSLKKIEKVAKENNLTVEEFESVL